MNCVRWWMKLKDVTQETEDPNRGGRGVAEWIMKPFVGKFGKRKCSCGNQIGWDLNPGVPFTDRVLWGQVI